MFHNVTMNCSAASDRINGRPKEWLYPGRFLFLNILVSFLRSIFFSAHLLMRLCKDSNLETADLKVPSKTENRKIFCV